MLILTVTLIIIIVISEANHQRNVNKYWEQTSELIMLKRQQVQNQIDLLHIKAKK